MAKRLTLEDRWDELPGDVRNAITNDVGDWWSLTSEGDFHRLMRDRYAARVELKPEILCAVVDNFAARHGLTREPI